MNFPFWIIVAAVSGTALSAAAADFDVSQKGRKFHPEEIDIKVGDTLRIHNDDEFLHHVYVRSRSPDFTFDSHEQPPGKTESITFTVAGDFNVLCDIHPKMKLIVHVK